MRGFSKDLTETIRLALEEEKKKVVARIDALTVQDPFSDPDRANNNSTADGEAGEESNHDRMESLILTLKSQLQDIDEALVRIGGGSYGFCKNCGQMIDTDRLAILPTAILCLACEQKKGH